MESVLIALGAFAAYLVAYHSYGKFLARKIFQLDDANVTPAHSREDGRDFVPTKAEVLFGHHYTSIAGTGPIVGPALGIIWGWVPALVWVLVGSIFMGAVHDFGAMVVSARNQGKSIGDIASTIISRRVQIMFLVIVFLALLIVIAVFCLVISVLFTLFPESVIPIWVEIPIAMVIGHLVYRRGMRALPLSIVGVVLLYVFVVVGTAVPLKMPALGFLEPEAVWMIVLLGYAFAASVLPVWRLLQPRDYINGHELFVVLFLLTLGVFVSHPAIVAPAFRPHPPDAPPFWPFLFITIACGAISGFHALVASGTSSKQVSKESHMLPIGYGGMLLEGVLAVLVIIAVAGGIGLVGESGLSGTEAWQSHYGSFKIANKSLGAKVGVFITGAAKMMMPFGIPKALAATVMGVFVASFAGTTLDTATRLQRYVIAEIGAGLKIRPLTNLWVATAVAVVTAGLLAVNVNTEAGTLGAKGGMILWPLFGATNQLLAALALLVITVYLKKRGRPTVYTLLPMVVMLAITGWAMVYNLLEYAGGGAKTLHLFLISAVILVLEAWMVVESAGVWLRGPAQTAEPAARP